MRESMARLLRDHAIVEQRVKEVEEAAAKEREKAEAEMKRRKEIEDRVAYRPDDNHLLRELGDV